MKKIKLFVFLNLAIFNFYSQDTTLTIFDEILFYDGYAGVVNFPTPEGVIRHRNDLYAKKLSTEDLLSLGSTLNLDVTIKASCDNYDRIGSVNLAFVPKGDTSYIPDNVQRIELGRFITPFMNKNIQPDEVPYSFNIDNIAKIVKDVAMNQLYDFWVELHVFGVPYAANTQVAGCAGRNDVFFGTLKLTSNSEVISSNDYILPLNFQNYLNDYQVGASDTIGKTTRTINFSLPTGLDQAKFYLITSNHGANNGGEEYNRRFHYIYFDSALVLTYKPGETTCEPYRIYNTQGNGIYGSNPKTNAQWQSFSNWCPGAVIPIREIDLGYLEAGEHSFKIDVPTAVFANNEGYFPISLYLQGTRDNLNVKELKEEARFTYIYPNPASKKATIQTNEEIKSITVTNLIGTQILFNDSKEIDLSSFKNGIYMVKIVFKNEKTSSFKLNVLNED
ncbi:MAG: peptide-N-glycosidase F-related protein [Bacteroidota bacterium]